MERGGLTQIGKYPVVRKLGEGATSEVYLCSDPFNLREVAVKVAFPESFQDPARGKAYRKLFLTEAKLAGKLQHPHICQIYDAVADEKLSYIVMEYVGGGTLERFARPEALLPIDRVVEMVFKCCRALEFAHKLGITHRDIKPANILFTEFGRAALTDFGISVSTQDGQQGVGVGVSPAWAPPEQVTKGQPMVPASDVYSLAATCWAMLGGRSPMIVPGGDNSNLALMARARNEPVPPLRREDVPEQLERVLVTAMAKRADQRFGSALELGRALQAIQVALHLPMTPIEVGEDTQDDPVSDDPASEEVGSTRISTFKVIDPEGAPPATTGPLAPAAPTAPSAYAAPAPVRDRASRDFTGPAIPAPVEDATVVGHGPDPAVVPASQPDDRSEPAPPAARTARTAVLAVVGLVLVGGVVAWQVLGGTTEGTTQDAEPTTSSGPADAIGESVPSPSRLALVRRGDEVVVRWRNPAPEEGDSFLYRVADPSQQRPLEGPVDSGPVTVPAEQGRTCVEVMLRRSNGQTSVGATECTR
jgi:serine/threonine protein kinase